MGKSMLRINRKQGKQGKEGKQDMKGLGITVLNRVVSGPAKAAAAAAAHLGLSAHLAKIRVWNHT